MMVMVGWSRHHIKPAGVFIADPVENAILFFLDAALEPVRSQHRNNGEGKNQRADSAKAMVSAMGWKEFAGRPGERVDREIARDDDGDGVEDGAIDVARGCEDDFVEVVSRCRGARRVRGRCSRP